MNRRKPTIQTHTQVKHRVQLNESHDAAGDEHDEVSHDDDDDDDCDYEFKCPICLEILIFPASLECGHTMCLECGQNMLKKICPVCRAQIKGKLQKNVLLDYFMKKRFGDIYTQKCNSKQDKSKYMKSARYELLRNVIENIATQGDLLHENEDFKGLPMTYQKLMTQIHTTTNIGFAQAEIEFTIDKMLSSQELIQIRNFIVVNNTDVIMQTISECVDHIDSDLMFEMLATPISVYMDDYPEIGAEMHKRRKRKIQDRDYDPQKNEHQMLKLIKKGVGNR